MAKSKTTVPAPAVPIERIANQIYLIRDQKVMLDSDLAKLYGVTTGNLNKAANRNTHRFPKDFRFQLTQAEADNLLFQIGRAGSSGHGGRRTPPYVFTEQGVAMLSSVLNSDRATDVNVAIMRTFVKIRELLVSDRELARKVEKHDQQIAVLFDAVKKLLSLPDSPKRNQIGYIHHKND